MTDTFTTKDCKEYPTLGYRFFLYDPNDGITFWKTEEERDKAAKDAIDSYLDDEWSDEVLGVVAGVVTHHTVEIDRMDKVGQLNEDGYDEAGQYWPSSDYDYSCNYALKPYRLAAYGTPTEPGLYRVSLNTGALAHARAAIAAHEAARPRLTPEEVEARFRAWWAESFPNAPAGPHAVRSHVAFALHLLGGEVQ